MLAQQWLNPFGKAFSQIRVSDLILVDHAGNLVEGGRPVTRAAFVIHSQAHQARPDVVAAAHTHSLHGKAFSSLGVPLVPLVPLAQDACAFEDHAGYSGYSGLVNDLEEGRRISAALAGHKAVILQNHGLLTVGASVAEAAWYFITMERSCQAQLLAMAAGTPHLIDGPHGMRPDLRPAARLVPVPPAVGSDHRTGAGPLQLAARASRASRPAARESTPGHLTASGFTGPPTPPRIGSGPAASRKS